VGRHDKQLYIIIEAEVDEIPRNVAVIAMADED
jgi:hypothetical protein